MTLFDLINTLPIWLKAICVILLIVWFFELFLFPFKFNLLNEKVKRLISLQEDTLREIQKKDEEQNRTSVMLSTLMGSLLKIEQKIMNDEKKEQNNTKKQ